MEKTYAPYPKWFGSAFKQLPGAQELWPVLQGALQAGTWQKREQFLVQAYEHLAIRHNALKLTRPLLERVTSPQNGHCANHIHPLPLLYSWSFMSHNMNGATRFVKREFSKCTLQHSVQKDL
jgi:hypothetical protein